MSQFKFVNDLNSALSMDDPLLRVPVPRWQKKNLDSSGLNNTANTSVNSSKVGLNGKVDKTPSKTPSKTPKNTPGKLAKTPNGGDRFIPNRVATDFELGHFKLTLRDEKEDGDEDVAQLQREKAMTENLQGRDPTQSRILAFQKKAPAPPDGFQNSLKVVYSQSKTPSTKAASRHVPQNADRILDAPDILDDYYLNLVDWSKSNILAVALRSSVYLWNAGTGTIQHLTELEGAELVTSVNWIHEGETLAIGTSMGLVQLWDAAQEKKMRTMDGHTSRVASLSWNSYILSSGCRMGTIVHHDVRQRDHNVASINAHTQEVCGLKWSPDGRYLASGGNDNILNIWAPVQGDFYSQPTPIYSFREHQAAVKALAWCPWQSGHLASGGGTADRHIRIWNCNNGVPTFSVDTKSQVCGLLWSEHYKEIISGHGYAHNQLIIWKYPTMTKVAEMTGHSARILQLALSPDGTTVLSAGADETLRLWKCFTVSSKSKKEGKESKFSDSIFLKKSIR